jgi:hypothetical protein
MSLVVSAVRGQETPKRNDPNNNLACVDSFMLPTFTNLARRSGKMPFEETAVVSVLVSGNGKHTIQVSSTDDNVKQEVEIFFRTALFKRECADKTVRLLFTFRLEGKPAVGAFTKYVFKGPNHFEVISQPELPVVH